MSHPQHMQALATANRIRLARAQLKRDLLEGRVTLAEALEHEDVGTMPVSDLIKAQWRWGEARTHKVLRLVLISERRTVGSLTDRQKRALVQICASGGAARFPADQYRPARYEAERNG